MKTIFLKSFEKDLLKINLDDSVKSSLKDYIDFVENCNNFTEIKNLKKLRNFKFAYRIKLGDYRIGVFIENNTIEFARILHRKEIYKYFP